MIPTGRVGASLAAALLVTAALAGCLAVDVSNCLVITAPGTYTLTGDVTAPSGESVCIDVRSSHVVVDGDGFTLSATDATNAYGVRVHNESMALTNVTVVDLTVVGFAEDGVAVENVRGMSFEAGVAPYVGGVPPIVPSLASDGPTPPPSFGDDFHGLRLENVSSVGNGDDGLSLDDVSDATVLNGLFTENGGEGIDLAGVTDVAIADSVASFNGGDGVRLDDPARLVPSRSDGNQQPFSDERPANENVLLRCLEIAANEGHGLSASDVENLTVTTSVVNGNGGDGVRLHDARNVSLVENVVTGNDGEQISGLGEADVDVGGERPALRHYQVDFAVGMPLCRVGPADDGSFYGDDDRLVAFLHGNSEDGEVRNGTSTVLPEYRECLSNVSIDVDEANGTATVSFTVEEDCELLLTFAAYEKPGPGFVPGDPQTRYDSRTTLFGAGDHSMTVFLPGGAVEGDE